MNLVISHKGLAQNWVTQGLKTPQMLAKVPFGKTLCVSIHPSMTTNSSKFPHNCSALSAKIKRHKQKHTKLLCCTQSNGCKVMSSPQAQCACTLHKVGTSEHWKIGWMGNGWWFFEIQEIGLRRMTSTWTLMFPGTWLKQCWRLRCMIWNRAKHDYCKHLKAIHSLQKEANPQPLCTRHCTLTAETNCPCDFLCTQKQTWLNMWSGLNVKDFISFFGHIETKENGKMISFSHIWKFVVSKFQRQKWNCIFLLLFKNSRPIQKTLGHCTCTCIDHCGLHVMCNGDAWNAQSGTTMASMAPLAPFGVLRCPKRSMGHWKDHYHSLALWCSWWHLSRTDFYWIWHKCTMFYHSSCAQKGS